MNIQHSLTAIRSIYIMPVVDDVRKQSAFQGFIYPLMNPMYSESICRTLIYPRDVCEIFMPPAEVLSSRMLGRSNNTYLLSFDSFKEIAGYFDTPFTFITCLEEHLEKVLECTKKFVFNPVLISDTDKTDFNLENINSPYIFDEMIFEKIQFASTQDSPYKEPFLELLKRELRNPKSPDRILNEEGVHHNVTVPLEAVLVSCGYEFIGVKYITPSLDKDNYIAEMLRLSRVMIECYPDEHRSITQSDVILYSPSIYGFLYDTDHSFWSVINRKLSSRKKRNFIKNNLIRNKNYSGIVFEDVESHEEAQAIYQDELIHPIMEMRRLELRYNTIAASFLALTNNCPALRLSNSINFYPKKFKNLETLSNRDDAKGRALFQRAFIEVTELIKSALSAEIINFVNDKTSKIIVCSDVPLEWVSFNSIPLMFSHEISRINTTPGNVFLQNAALATTIELNSEDLNQILIVRSFRENDPIREHLNQALLQLENTHLNIHKIDVSSESELVTALNDYDGHVVIFDCHGGHGGVESNGWLNIGNSQVDLWSLKGQARIPMIVILSACSTSPVSGSHASVANGLLYAGALSVIGTFLPVDSRKSTLFVIRILLQIAYLLNILSEKKFKVTNWRTIISVVMKVSYLYDILDGFETVLNLISSEDRKKIENRVINTIYSISDQWHDCLINEIGDLLGKNRAEVSELLAVNFPIIETMYYQQLGRPENIIINL